MRFDLHITNRLPRRLLAVMIGIVATILFAAVAMAAAGSAPTSPASPISPQKQAILRQIAAQATAAANSPHAPKHPQPAPTSCPLLPLDVGIHPDFPASFPDKVSTVAVIAPTASQPYEYLVFAGSRLGNSQQGMLIVVRSYQDACAPGAPGDTVTYYNTPYQDGTITLTQISGSTLTFTAATGIVGHFDYLTGTFG